MVRMRMNFWSLSIFFLLKTKNNKKKIVFLVNGDFLGMIKKSMFFFVTWLPFKTFVYFNIVIFVFCHK